MRTTSGLFVACTENVLLVLFLYTLLNGLMELVMPADFSPAMRGALISQLVLVLVTGALVLGISVWDRAREMGIVFFPPERKEEKLSEKNEVEHWIVERMALCRSTLSVCSAYCVMTLGLLLLFLAELLQAASGLGLDTSVVYRTRTMTMPESNVTELYASTQRLDWVQAVSGGSGWMRKDNNTFATADTIAMPIVGSIFSGVVMAFLAVAFLMSLFLALTSMPEGERSYLLLEPRGLTIVNGIVSFASTQGVGLQFARCNGSGGSIAGGVFLFLLFCLVACWLDELPAIIVQQAMKRRIMIGALASENAKAAENEEKAHLLMLSPPQPPHSPEESKNETPANKNNQQAGWIIAQKVVQCFLILAIGFAPLYMTAALVQQEDGMPGTVMIFSGLLSGLSCLVGLLDVLLFSGDRMKSSLDRALELTQDPRQQHPDDTSSHTVHDAGEQKQGPVGLGPLPDSQPVSRTMRFSSSPSLSSSFQQRQYHPAVGRKSQEARMRSTSSVGMPSAATLSPSMFLLRNPLDLSHPSSAAEKKSSSSSKDNKWHMA